MRYILEKHVVRPRIFEKGGGDDPHTIGAMERMAETIKGVIRFMGKYFESVKQV
jgi:hypothetical protein